MNGATETIVTIATALVGLAILAVLVSRNSNTSGVITAAGNAFTSALNVAVSPVTMSTGSGGMGSWTGGFPNLGR
jgi:hypothetical protein